MWSPFLSERPWTAATLVRSCAALAGISPKYHLAGEFATFEARYAPASVRQLKRCTERQFAHITRHASRWPASNRYRFAAADRGIACAQHRRAGSTARGGESDAGSARA